MEVDAMYSQKTGSETVGPAIPFVPRVQHTPTQGFILAQNVILDRETRKSVAVLRNGQVFRDDKEGAKIATVVGSYLYDVNGNLVGYLDGDRVIGPRTESMPIAFRKLLKGGC
jgi:hypothetical protein